MGFEAEAGVGPIAGAQSDPALLLGQLLALTGGEDAFYLDIRELEKCFIQEIPGGTMVIGACGASPGSPLPP